MISPASNLVEVGQTKQMTAVLVSPGGAQSDVTARVLWSSDKPSIVSIVKQGSQAGLATALSIGVANITASDPVSGATSSAPGGQGSKLSVPGMPQSVTIFPRPTSGSSLSGAAGTTMQLKARVQFLGGATQGVNAQVTWSSSDPTVVKISNGHNANPAGFAQLLKPGSVTISIAYPRPGSPPPPGSGGKPVNLGASIGLIVTAN
ncbi:MAG TPA: Ig-like domain-containing protein [Candidatus Bathyarchaeia archaeon]|nr:Ig-like domain-containing protein [Candidatus Bathyarchaeia archaeon]